MFYLFYNFVCNRHNLPLEIIGHPVYMMNRIRRISLLSIIFSWEVKNITECWQDCSENKKKLIENDKYYV